ncbi:hypothetical protein DFJ73DRAFT_804341 [Zopfochytrium polystomum]|nr:hypothetical protein DFJ73DRAFT_804341 [Zopfochytrium polystomum]
MQQTAAVNAGAGLASAAALLAYHAWLAHTIVTRPSATVYGLNATARRAWVASVMIKKQDIVAIQSLRNWIMGATALASTSVVIIFGFVAFVATIATHTDAISSSDSTPPTPLGKDFGFVLDAAFGYKVLGILVVYMAAFFAFVNAVRFFNHACLVINITVTPDELSHLTPSLRIPAKLPLSPVVVASMVNRGAFYYHLGMRAYYLSFPVIAYLWGPWALLGASLVLCVVLHQIDLQVSYEMFESGAAHGDGDGRWAATATAAAAGTTWGIRRRRRRSNAARPPPPPPPPPAVELVAVMAEEGRVVGRQAPDSAGGGATSAAFLRSE